MAVITIRGIPSGSKPDPELFYGDTSKIIRNAADGKQWRLNENGAVEAATPNYGDLNDKTIPFVDQNSISGSSFEQETGFINARDSIDTKTFNAVTLGEIKITAVGDSLSSVNLNTDSQQSFVSYQIDSMGSTPPTYPKTGETEVTPSAAGRVLVFSGSEITFEIPNANTGIASAYRFASATATQVRDCNFQIRTNSPTDERPTVDYKRDFKGEGFTLNNLADPVNDFDEIELPYKPFFEAGETLYVTIRSDAGDDLELFYENIDIGGGNIQTIPWIEVVGQQAIVTQILTSENTGWALYQNSGSSISTPSNTWVKLTNDALGSRTTEEFLPETATTFWNPTLSEVVLDSVKSGNRINLQILFEFEPGIITDNFAARVLVTTRDSGGSVVATWPSNLVNQELGIDDGSGVFQILASCTIFAETEDLSRGEAIVQVQTDALFSSARIAEIYISSEAEPVRE